MNIVISSIIDVRRAPNGRLHHVLERLGEEHDVCVVSPRDEWRPSQTDVHEYGSADRMVDVEVEYLTDRSISMILQEVGAEVFLRDVDVDWSAVDVHLDYSTLFLGRAISRRVRSAGGVTVYDLMDDVVAMVRESPQIPRGLHRIGAGLAKWTLDRNLRNATHVIYTTEELRRIHGIDRRKSTRIPNGVDTESFTPGVDPATEGVPEREFILGYVGTNREWVELELLVRTVATLRESGLNVGLLVVGEEGGIDRVEELADRLGVRDVSSFVGTVPYEDVPSYISAMDVGTIPFSSSEISTGSLPLKLFEYLACGIPVVSTPLPPVRKTTGDIVEFAEDDDAFAAAVGGLAHDPERRAEIGRRGRSLVEERFSWDAQVERIEEVLRQAAEQTEPRPEAVVR